MGNRRKSWHSALMEGMQTVTLVSAFALLIIFVYNITYGYNVMEYYYLIGPIFVLGALCTFKYTYKQMTQAIKWIKSKKNHK